MMEPKKIRRSYSLKEKQDIIDMLESGNTQHEVAFETKISRDSIATIWKNKSKIKALFLKSTCNPVNKKARKLKYDSIDKAMYDWFRLRKNLNVPLDGNILRAKATFFAEALGLKDFSASAGWLDKWRLRHNVSFRKEESKDTADNWIKIKWPVLRADYRDEDIYNADETGLFFETLPDKTYQCREEQSKGLKLNEERVTVLVCANMTGCDKRKLLVIGKNVKPKGFPVNLKSLPVTYSSNKKSCTTGQIFEKWIRKWDAELQRNNKNKILLLVDNCSSHIKVSNLHKIRMIFFPSNVLLQPMKLGVFKNLKTYYRRLLIQKLLNHLEDNSFIPTINLLDAISILKIAWDSVSPLTITNCFRRGQLLSEPELTEDETDFNHQNEVLICELMFKFSIERYQDYKMDDYVAVDEDVPITAMLSDEEILNSVREVDNSMEFSDQDLSEEDSSDDDDVTDVEKHLKGLKNWTIENDLQNSLQDHLFALDKAVLEINTKNLIQSKFLDFDK